MLSIADLGGLSFPVMTLFIPHRNAHTYDQNVGSLASQM